MESYNDGIIDDDKFVLLYEGNFSKNPEFPYVEYEMFDLDAMDDTECKAEFRFRKMKFPDWQNHWIFLKHFFATKAQQLLE